MWLLINFILALFVCYIIYNTALSFLGMYEPFKHTILPIILFGIIAYLSKIIMKTPPIVHTINMVSACVIIIYVFKRVRLILCLCASLLTFIIIILGSLFFACPLLNQFKINISTISFNNFEWIIFNIGEIFLPMVLLIINRIKKLSLIHQLIEQ